MIWLESNEQTEKSNEDEITKAGILVWHMPLCMLSLSLYHQTLGTITFDFQTPDV